jgi:hypothetical protein
MREPARQHPLDKTEELPVRTRPDRRLTNRERDQRRITDKRRPTAASRDPILVSENVAATTRASRSVLSLVINGSNLSARVR